MKKVNFFQLRRQKRAKVFHRRRRIADASWVSKNTHYRAMMGHREVSEVIKATHLLNEKRFALSFFALTKSGGGHHNLKSSISHFSLTPDRRRRSAEVSSISPFRCAFYIFSLPSLSLGSCRLLDSHIFIRTEKLRKVADELTKKKHIPREWKISL